MLQKSHSQPTTWDVSVPSYSASKTVSSPFSRPSAFLMFAGKDYLYRFYKQWINVVCIHIYSCTYTCIVYIYTPPKWFYILKLSLSKYSNIQHACFVVSFTRASFLVWLGHFLATKKQGVMFALSIEMFSFFGGRKSSSIQQFFIQMLNMQFGFTCPQSINMADE